MAALANLRAISLLVAFLLTSCGHVNGFEAFVSCSERLEAEFPEAAKMANDDVGEDISSMWNVSENGAFEFVVPGSDDGPLWKCFGNSKTERSIGLNLRASLDDRARIRVGATE